MIVLGGKKLLFYKPELLKSTIRLLYILSNTLRGIYSVVQAAIRSSITYSGHIITGLNVPRFLSDCPAITVHRNRNRNGGLAINF